MKISDFVYFPRQGGYRFTQYQCAYAIEGKEDHNGRYIRYHQCNLKPKHPIGEHTFCKLHFDIITKKLKESETKTLGELGF